MNLIYESPIYRIKLKERLMVLHQETGKRTHTYMFQVTMKLMKTSTSGQDKWTGT